MRLSLMSLLKFDGGKYTFMPIPGKRRSINSNGGTRSLSALTSETISVVPITQSSIMRIEILTSVFFSSGREISPLQYGHIICFSKYLPLTISNLSPLISLLAFRKALWRLFFCGLKGDAVKYMTFSRTWPSPRKLSQSLTISIQYNRRHAASVLLLRFNPK